MLAPVAEVVFTAIDGSGSTTTFRLYVLSTMSPAAAHAAAGGLINRIAGLSGCAIVRVDVIYREILSTISGEGEINPHGVFIFASSTPDQVVIAAVPGIDSAYILPDGQIDTSQTAVSDFIDGVLSNNCCNPFGYIASDIQSALSEYRAYGQLHIP